MLEEVIHSLDLVVEVAAFEAEDSVAVKASISQIFLINSWAGREVPNNNSNNKIGNNAALLNHHLYVEVQILRPELILP